MEITPFTIIMTTCPNYDEANNIANGLVKNRLAACVQLSEIKSFCIWDGQVQNETEVRLMIKTRSWLYPQVEEFIIKNHSYSIPEIISVPIERGTSSYLEWIEKVTDRSLEG